MVSEPVLTIASKNSRSLARSGMVKMFGSVSAGREVSERLMQNEWREEAKVMLLKVAVCQCEKVLSAWFCLCTTRSC